nr:hypothetical protein [uncultured Draconibacterium sp.]
MKKIRCKFECVQNKHSEEYSGSVVEFSAVVEGSEENKSFSEYTPSGELTMFVSDKTEAAKFFEKGKEYYLDIIDVETVEKPKKEQPEHLKVKEYKLRAVYASKSITPVVKGRGEKEMRKNAQKEYPGINIISFEQLG